MFMPNYASIPGEKRVRYIMPHAGYVPERVATRSNLKLAIGFYKGPVLSASSIH